MQRNASDDEIFAQGVEWVDASMSLSEALGERQRRRILRLSPAKLQRVVLSHPHDAQMWLAYAKVALSISSAKERVKQTAPDRSSRAAEYPMNTSTSQAYQKAIAVDPQSPVARFRYALCFLGQAGDKRWEEEDKFEWATSYRPAPPLPRTAAETSNLHAARDLLQECRDLAPDNAACDYLLVWTYLEEHQDQEALAAARSAIGKSRWSRYGRGEGAALLQLFKEAGVSEHYQIWYPGNLPYISCHSQMRSVARVLIALGDEFRTAGQHEQALLCYEAVMHLGHLMRVDAFDIIDGLTGMAITGLAASSFLTEAERTQIWESNGPEQARELMTQARIAKFTDYARWHERADLACLYAADIEAGAGWKRGASKVIDSDTRRRYEASFGDGMLNAAGIFILGVAVLAIGVIVGILSVVGRCWREPGTRLAWGYVDWLFLLVICVAPGQIAAVIGTALLGGQPEAAWMAAVLWSLVGVGVGLLGWLVGVFIVAMRKRRNLMPENRPGRGRTYLAGLRTLVAPTLAALILLSVISAWPVQRNRQPWIEERRAIIIQGDVEYWGIGSGEGGAQDRMR